MLIFAIFVGPQLFKLLQYLPSVDPLIVIMGIFAALAGVQHISGQAAEAGAAASGNGRRQASRAAEEQRCSEPSAAELVAEAEHCLKQNSYGKTQDLAKHALDLDPECTRAWELLATAQKWDGRRGEALATATKARDIYEVDSKILTSLATELSSKVNTAEEAAEAEAKGEEHIGRRHYDLAEQCFSRGLELLGDGKKAAAASASDLHLRLLRRHADCAQQLQDWVACRRDATAVLEACPGDVKALLQRAASNEALEKFKAALEDARELLRLDPKNSAANRIVHNCSQALRD